MLPKLKRKKRREKEKKKRKLWTKFSQDIGTKFLIEALESKAQK